MVSYSAKLDSRTKQHTQFGVSVSNGSRDMAWTKVAEKKEKKNEHGQNYIASPTGIANNNKASPTGIANNTTTTTTTTTNNNNNNDNNKTGSRSPCMRPRSDPPNFGPIERGEKQTNDID